MEEIKSFLECVVKFIASKPDDVTIDIVDGGSTKVFQVKAAKEDVGKIIGKKGRSANSIRILAAIIAAKHGVKSIIEVIE